MFFIKHWRRREEIIKTYFNECFLTHFTCFRFQVGVQAPPAVPPDPWVPLAGRSHGFRYLQRGQGGGLGHPRPLSPDLRRPPGHPCHQGQKDRKGKVRWWRLHNHHWSGNLTIVLLFPFIFFFIVTKAQGTSHHAGYFFAGYGYFPYPNVPGIVYKDPDIRKSNLYKSNKSTYEA